MQTTGLAGIEPTAYRLGGDRSIQLSYSPKQHLIVSDFVTIAGLIVIRSARIALIPSEKGCE